MIWYLSHPEVVIDPALPVPDWRLSETGQARLRALADCGWPRGLRHLICSPELKARETAAILAGVHAVAVDVLPGTGEVDRSSTGYLPSDRHEALADALFADPDRSAEGWETARSAQARIVAAVLPVLRQMQGPILIVGHGAVGTRLWCHIAGREIGRAEDQPHGGSIWAARRMPRAIVPVHSWRPMEDVGAQQA